MMHGTKKSYSSIVPAKPANKADASYVGLQIDDEVEFRRLLEGKVRGRGDQLGTDRPRPFHAHP